MEDLREDLLDTVAVITDKLKKIGIGTWFLILAIFCSWPLFYFLLAFGFVKLIFSGIVASYLARIYFKSLK